MKTGPKKKPAHLRKDWITRYYTKEQIKQLGGKPKINVLIDNFVASELIKNDSKLDK